MKNINFFTVILNFLEMKNINFFTEIYKFKKLNFDEMIRANMLVMLFWRRRT